MRLMMLAAAGAMAISMAPMAEKSVLVEFRNKFDNAVEEAKTRNLPLLFIFGKDH